MLAGMRPGVGRCDSSRIGHTPFVVTDRQLFDLIRDTDCFRALDKLERGKVEKAIQAQPASTPRSNLAKAAFFLARRINPMLPPPPPPPPPDQPPAKRYAPRSHNVGDRDQDPRFCCKPEYGVKLVGGVYVDEMGIRYDTDHMFDMDSQRERGYIVPELTHAGDMNGKEPCDQYVGPTGMTIGGAAGYPPGSYHR
jgi:hypothetical protein